VILETEDEDWDVSDTSWDEEIICKLYGDLNRDLLGPPGDGQVIVICDSEEEEQDDNHTDVNVVPSSLRVPHLHLPLPLTTMAHLIGCKMIVVAVSPTMKPTLP
jgi:hypothetical protein